jgi:hypothetical protein
LAALVALDEKVGKSGAARSSNAAPLTQARDGFRNPQQTRDQHGLPAPNHNLKFSAAVKVAEVVKKRRVWAAFQ